jgi:MFS transporter, MHS family, citrate/tricarballylate:H+ symporter
LVATTADAGRAAHLPFGRVAAVGLGNALEFYDFLTYSYFAIQIGRAFFPDSWTSHGLSFSLASFGVGFITRPLGGIVIGRYGDRAGRTAAMLWSFGLMGVGILGLACTPSYTQIGIAAPVLLLLFRLLQGFALGGEVGPSMAYIVEAAPPRQRGLYVASLIATQYLASLSAGVVGFALSGSLSSAQLDAWGWRVAFLLGAAIVPLGLYIRRRLPETLHARDGAAPAATQRQVPTRLIVLGLLMLCAGSTTSYVVDYMATYAQDTLKLGAHVAFGATIVGAVCFLMVAPLAGMLSDRIGRKPVMLWGVGLMLALAFPCYLAMSTWRSAPVVYAATFVLSAVFALIPTMVMLTLSESLPRAVRSGAFGLLYAVAIAVFGGFAQFNVKWLIDLTGSPLAPAGYLSAVLLIGGAAMLAMRESAPCKA